MCALFGRRSEAVLHGSSVCGLVFRVIELKCLSAFLGCRYLPDYLWECLACAKNSYLIGFQDYWGLFYNIGNA